MASKDVVIMRTLLTRAATVVLPAFVLVAASCQPGTQPAPVPQPTPAPTSVPTLAPAPPAPLDRVQISPEAVTLTPGDVQPFSAKAFDKYKNDIKDLTFRWTITEGGGRVYENGIFVAGTEAGSQEIR